MLRYGIPDYRLPPEILDRDISHILWTGIDVHTGISIGKDVGIENIQKDYDAVYIAIGAHSDKSCASKEKMPKCDQCRLHAARHWRKHHS